MNQQNLKQTQFHLATQEDLKQLHDALFFINSQGLDGRYLVKLEKLPHKYTAQQRKAIYQYCTMLANALNDAGWTQSEVLAKAADRDWNKDSVVFNLWKALQKPMIGHDSISRLLRDEVSPIYETLNRHTSNLFGVGMPFPNKHDLERQRAA